MSNDTHTTLEDGLEETSTIVLQTLNPATGVKELLIFKVPTENAENVYNRLAEENIPDMLDDSFVDYDNRIAWFGDFPAEQVASIYLFVNPLHTSFIDATDVDGLGIHDDTEPGNMLEHLLPYEGNYCILKATGL